jgi:hypothetical protein
VIEEPPQGEHHDRPGDGADDAGRAPNVEGLVGGFGPAGVKIFRLVSRRVNVFVTEAQVANRSPDLSSLSGQEGV